MDVGEYHEKRAQSSWAWHDLWHSAADAVQEPALPDRSKGKKAPPALLKQEPADGCSGLSFEHLGPPAVNPAIVCRTAEASCKWQWPSELHNEKCAQPSVCAQRLWQATGDTSMESIDIAMSIG